jgi:multidrug transporter EmrE-like cation transporter
MNPNVALGIGVGGSFLLSQLALAVIFRSSVSAVQCAGIVAITAGMVALTMQK